MGKVVLCCSGNGGVGKTTLTINIGASLAQNGYEVLIFDMNTGLRNDDIYLGLEDRILYDFGDVISGICQLDKAIVKHDTCKHLSLLSCPQYREVQGLSASHIKALYAKLKKEYDIILVDCPVVFGSQFHTMVCGADEAIVVTDCDNCALRNADAVNKKLAGSGVFTRHYIVNKVCEELYGNPDLPDLAEIDKLLCTDCLGVVPYDRDIHLDNNCGHPSLLSGNIPCSEIFKNIALRLMP